MSNQVLVIGESGHGKSTAIETLDPSTTFLINIAKKALPFRGWKKLYTPLTKEGKGNYIETEDAEKLIKTLDYVSDKRPEIKVIVIDDYQYLMSFEFMDRATEKGFDKFTQIGLHGFEPIKKSKNLRPDLTIVFLAHLEDSTDAMGNRKLKMKTIGKLLDEKITIEGLFTVVLMSMIGRDNDGNIWHYFLTKSDGSSTVKSPKGMFEELKIPNDLKMVVDKVTSYYNEE
jgi:hypothetical protein